ncbi:MAG: hypothetical protein SGI88_04390 [Candidatus Hydrogenedentes bacterium]|nr:hypothetical protein [Candidatus Hydrogenedentota bacterium]
MESGLIVFSGLMFLAALIGYRLDQLSKSIAIVSSELVSLRNEVESTKNDILKRITFP